MQVSEAIYRCMLATFMQHRNELDLRSFPSHHFLSAQIEAAIADRLEDCYNFSCPSDVRGIIIAIQNMLSKDFKSLEDEFMQFVTHFSEIDATWRFWLRFIIEDFASYLALFIGVRTRSWNLRMAGVKEMAPLFVVFDRPTYRKLIPHHLTEVLLMPNEVLLHLKHGAFSASITDRSMHCEALDEVHEMKINKEAKSMVVRPTDDNMHRLSNSLPFMARMAATFTKELFPERLSTSVQDAICGKVSTTILKVEENIRMMIQVVTGSGMFEVVTENRGLWNYFTQTQASPEQSHDLLAFRKIGQTHLNGFINSSILHTHSAQAPNQTHRLKTFSTSTKEKERHKQIEREEKLIQMCMKKQIAMAEENPLKRGTINTYSRLPRAIVDQDGLLY